MIEFLKDFFSWGTVVEITVITAVLYLFEQFKNWKRRKHTIAQLTAQPDKQYVTIAIDPSLVNSAKQILMDRVKSGQYKTGTGINRVFSDAIKNEGEIHQLIVQGRAITATGANAPPELLFGSVPDYVEIAIRVQLAAEQLDSIAIDAPMTEDTGPVILDDDDDFLKFMKAVGSQNTDAIQEYIGEIPPDAVWFVDQGLVLHVKKKG